MYTPSFNRIADRTLLIEAMRSHSFALLSGGEPLSATHLPLAVKDEGEHGVLEGHFALANPHWQALAGRETLVVFTGPHSYVSPTLYEEPTSVPTWNYIAVHACGKLSLVEDADAKAIRGRSTGDLYVASDRNRTPDQDIDSYRRHEPRIQ